jgi:hypothetical protein
MRNWKSFRTLLTCALFLIIGFAQNSSGEGRIEASAAAETWRVAFVSDTQSPIFPETIALPRNNNELARAKIFDSIFGFRPHSVFHLGDLVSLGVLLLNSNISVLTAEEQAKQLWWYQETLRELDKDSTVGIVVVACHHSPYTNSTIVSPSGDVQETFVPPFLQSAKTRIFLSGHAHASEHFRISTKDFLVIGGGGGLQHPLLTGPESRWQDLFPQKTEKRMFHYLEGIITSTSATFTVRMLNDDFSLFVDAMTMRFDFAAVRPGAATKD